MTLNDTAVEMKRISFENNTFYKEEEPWVIDIPVKKETFRYTHEKRMVNRRKQYFEEGGNIEFLQQEKDGKNYKQLKFTQAKHEDLIHSYRIKFENNRFDKEYMYFSDFFLLKEDRSEELIVKIPDEVKKGNYTVSIYAIESFGLESESPLNKTILVE